MGDIHHKESHLAGIDKNKDTLAKTYLLKVPRSHEWYLHQGMSAK